MVSGGKAAGRAAEGIIAKAVKDLFRVVAKDVEKDAGKDALKATERDLARAAEKDVARDAERDATRSLDRRATCGDPIDVATGAVVHHEVDADLPGLLPLVLSRTHLSSYRAGRWFGPTWASTVDQRLEFDFSGARYVGEDGMVLRYRADAGGVLEAYPADGPRLRLAAAPGGGYALADPRAGRTLHFARHYTTTGEQWPLVAVTDRNGHRIDLDRDPGGNLTAVRHSGGYHVTVETAGDRVVALYLYDAAAGTHVPLRRFGYDAAGHLAEVVNSSGLPMRLDYDGEGRLARWTDRNGAWYRYEYDDAGRCVRATGSGDQLSVTLDFGDRVTTATDSLGHTTAYHRNDLGQVVREVNAVGAATVSEWDGQDRLLARTDPLGHTTRYGYDADGNMVSVSHPNGTQAAARYNELGLPVSIVDPDGSVWQHEYDERGNLLAVVDPAGGRRTFGYDGAGRLVAATDELGQVRQVHTNAAGQVLAVTDAAGGTTRFARDAFGRVAEQTDPLGNTTRFGWTTEGRIAVHTLPDGAAERWSYDPEGNLVEHTGLAGHTVRTEIGGFDLPVAETGPDGRRMAFGYDTELRLTSVTDPQGLVWTYEYDPAGALVAETDFTGRTRRYARDAAGQLAARTDHDGVTIAYVRDPMGNVVEERLGEEVTSFEYDPLGRLRAARNADAEVSVELDAAGRVVAETCNGQVVRSRYDAAGQRVRRRTPSGVDSVWEYDPAGRPAALHTRGQTVRFGHDAAGREVERRFGAAALTRGWDAASRPRQQTLVGAGSEVVLRRGYTYRPDGELIVLDEQPAGGRGYTLDASGRVTGVQGPAGWAERYGYDPAGNVTGASWPAPTPADADPQGPREYAGALLRWAGNVRFEHDARGRVVLRQHQRLSDRLTWRYEWDARDRLVAVHTPDGRHWRYRYDPLGRRIAKQQLAPDGRVLEQVTFAWDGDRLAEQTYSGWGPAGPVSHTTGWEFEPETYRPVCQVEHGVAGASQAATQAQVDARFYAIVTDLAGAPTELVDPGGQIAWRQHATLWGAPLGVPAGPAYCPLRFPGQYFDPESRLHYNYHRYYDPSTGRYASSDPIGLDGGPNPYRYAPNPLTRIDPLGLTTGCRPGGYYTARSRDHVYSHGHAANSPRIPGKSRFRPTEGGQKFTDEVINHPGTRMDVQSLPDGRTRYAYHAPDLGRTTGWDRHGNPVRGGRVVIESDRPWSMHNLPYEVVTQFPQDAI